MCRTSEITQETRSKAEEHPPSYSSLGLTSIELARDEKLAPIGGSAELTGVQEGLPTSLGDRMTTPHHLVLLEETGTIIVANHSGVAITGVSSEVTGASAAIKAPSGRIESGGNIEEGVTGVDVVGKGNVTIEKKTGNINSGGDVINAITGIRQTSETRTANNHRDQRQLNTNVLGLLGLILCWLLAKLM